MPGPNGLVSIKRLKARTAAQYRPGTPFREVVLSEPDELPREELLAKLVGWVTLIRLAEAELALHATPNSRRGGGANGHSSSLRR
jgi:hypothetical protein